MSPFILPGSTLNVERIPVEAIQKGDVVCYIGGNASGVVHRVTRKIESDTGTALFTRGDAQDSEEEVPQESVVSIVRRVEHWLFSYDTDSTIGRIIASIALGEDLKTSLARAVCRRSWQAIHLARSKVLGTLSSS
ncbi:MAG: hypothetical protein GY847_26205 [Proteobacteria bacterium]|nr:hypothetical protein [Pseudomonadota bacterium]